MKSSPPEHCVEYRSASRNISSFTVPIKTVSVTKIRNVWPVDNDAQQSTGVTKQKYPGGTLKSIHTDLEVLGAAPTALRRNDVEAERIFKPVREEQEEEGFSPGGEDMAGTQNEMTKPEPKPVGRRSPEEESSKSQSAVRGRRLGGEKEQTDRPRSGKSVAQSDTETKQSRKRGRREVVYFLKQ
ncbi:hypothetical protein NDU88_007935 [Pleurodeles waltl]|uniref:Uncharacterized protein n=1 Tax=Pleurodeles waltl TaxID=8319 RepID=A0AAV7P3K1_PLEWA|nr:hypothetical protein NDU88_007935 [Pleurodeles waltl]